MSPVPTGPSALSSSKRRNAEAFGVHAAIGMDEASVEQQLTEQRAHARLQHHGYVTVGGGLDEALTEFAQGSLLRGEAFVLAHEATETNEHQRRQDERSESRQHQLHAAHPRAPRRSAPRAG